MKQISQLKTQVGVTTANASDLISTITMSEPIEAWGWANTLEWLKDLRDASAKMQMAKKNAFWENYVIRDEMKHHFESAPTEVFISECIAAKLELSQAEEALKAEIEALEDHRQVRERKKLPTGTKRSKPGASGSKRRKTGKTPGR